MKPYVYRPLRFYLICFAATWAFWIPAIFIPNGISLMVLGLLAPAASALAMVFTSHSAALKQDLKRKLTGFYRLNLKNILGAVLVFFVIVAASILLSTLFGQSLDQFCFTGDFSFSVGGTSALLTIVLAATLEEMGWRGYGEDALAYHYSWFTESIVFGLIWAVWHLPLFWIEGSYHNGLRELGLGYALNFLISVIPLDFLTTWVYVKNNRSMLASILFHLFVNTMQEKIAMTPRTKCVETFVVAVAAVIIVLKNKELFFEKEHIGNLLNEKNR